MAKPRPPVVHVRTRDELLAEFAEQRSALEKFGHDYDSGLLWQAKHLAQIAYLLLHDGLRNTKSLMGQLGIRTKIKYLDTSRGVDSSMIPNVPLASTLLSSGGKSTFQPLLETSKLFNINKFVGFEKWWNGPVYLDHKGRLFTRHNLVWHMRTQDGGGHYDESLDNETFHFFRTENDRRFTLTKTASDGSQTSGPMPNADRATMRQIAWELEQSLLTIDQTLLL